MIHAGGALAREGIRPPGDLYVAAVVQEEVGGLGSIKLVQTVRPDCAGKGLCLKGSLWRQSGRRASFRKTFSYGITRVVSFPPSPTGRTGCVDSWL